MARKQIFPGQFSLMEIGVCTSRSRMSLSTIPRYLPNAAPFHHCPCLLRATDGRRPFNAHSLRPYLAKRVFLLLHTNAVETHTRIQHNWMQGKQVQGGKKRSAGRPERERKWN